MSEPETKPKPKGRPPKMVQITIMLDPCFDKADPKITVGFKDVQETIDDIMLNGYKFGRRSYQQIIFPSYIRGIMTKDL